MLFIHEMTHIYQEQVLGQSLVFRKIFKSRSGYEYDFGRDNFGNYNIEQQARMVSHGWALTQGFTFPSGLPGSIWYYKFMVPLSGLSEPARPR